ncbi:MAG: ARPP-1 family domain-containing protein [Candidatus Thorarchaeota archaeon]|jgi:hypothetical protein
MGANMNSEIISLVNSSTMGATQIYGNIAVTEIINHNAERYGDLLSMSLALEMGFLDVSETGNVPRLDFDASRPTLVRSGEAVLGGGKQDRVVRRSAIIEGRQGADVFCIEAGRWSPSDQNWIHTDTPISFKRAILNGASQQVIWNKVQQMLGRMNVRSGTNALGAVYQSMQHEFQWRVDKFKIVDGQVGMIVTMDNAVAGFEYFGDQMCFSRDWKSILGNSYVPDAGNDYEGNMTPESVVAAIGRFRDELRSGRRKSEVVHHDNEVVYACAV